MSVTLIDTLAVGNELGEGIIWDHQNAKIWWTDILQSTLYRYTPESKALESWDTPERLCCFAPIDGRHDLIAAFESGFAFYQPETGTITWIEKLEQDNPGSRFNDGRTDRQGRLWAGTMIEDEDTAPYKGSLYCLHSDNKITKSLEGLSIPNSLCWSPDGTTVYHTDTPTQTIYKYAFNTQTAELGSPEVFVETQRNCYPDGSIVDAHGFVWNAQWGGSQVVRYAPDGAVDLVVDIPTSQPTCVAFGGKNLDCLFVTTARADMTSPEHQAGDVFVFKTNYQGLAESRFKTV